MKCNKCRNELRIGVEQVGVDDKMMPVFHRFGYCDKCMFKYNLDEKLEKEKRNKNIWNAIGIAFILFCVIIVLFCDGEDETVQSTTQPVAYDTSTTEILTSEAVRNTDTFTDDFAHETNMRLSKKLTDILLNRIGFSEIIFCEKINKTENYSILADGRELVITVIDNDFRIFKPNSDIVLYEDSEVLLTQKDMEEKIVDSDEAVVWFAIAQGIIEEHLKNPKSADFPSCDEAEYQIIGNIIAVRSFVYAENSFGAEVKSSWTVQFKINEDESYVVNYIEIDGQKTGEFITE